MLPKILVTLTLIALCLSLVSAQEVTGNLEGRILDTQGNPVPGVTVSVTSPALQGQRGISSDDNGSFRLLWLPNGRYTVKISHVAFQPGSINDVQVRLGKTTTIGDVTLQESTVGMQEVVISGERTLLDPTSTTGGGNLPSETFEDLPLERNYRSIATILPNANQSFLGDDINMSGASGIENRYFINGNEVTDPVGGQGGINLPYNFIHEVEVRSGGYEAEYKSSLGGVVNVVTYSGGNNLSGQAFGFYTNNNFSGSQQLATTEPPKGDFSQYDYGFRLGGPILQDKLWFFGAYAPFYRNEDIMLPGLGYYPDEVRTQSFSGKLTWKATDVLDFSATVIGDPTTRNAVVSYGMTVLNVLNPDPLLQKQTTGGYAMLVDSRYLAGKNVYIQGSLSYTDGKNHQEPRTEAGYQPYFQDFTTSTVSGGYGMVWFTDNQAIEGRLSATLMAGQHEFKTGVAHREVAAKSEGHGVNIYKYDDTTYYSVEAYAGGGTITNQVPSAFIQDAWSPSKYLCITAGLRWDGLFIIATNGQLVSRVLDQYQPRLGLVITPGGNESQKIFASVGRYAEDFLLTGSLFYHSDQGRQVGLYYNHDPRIDPTGFDTAYVFQGSIPPGVLDLEGQYYDEATLGYEQLVTSDLKFTTRGTYRRLRQILEDMITSSGSSYYGNPGVDPVADFPAPRRDYLSLELTVEKSWGSNINLLASYVLSRNYGNYVGLFDQDINASMPNVSPQWDWADIFTNSMGLLPNDRTHVFKLNGSYRFNFGLSCAASFFWETGTPLSEFSGSHGGTAWVVNLVPRGTAGRLPSLWDLNLRFTYGMPFVNLGQFRPKLILDVFHVASQKKVVAQDQIHYADLDAEGNPTFPSPTYGMPTKFQPPTSLRLGIEVNF